MEKVKTSTANEKLKAADIQVKTLTWNEIHCGDCVMQAGATLNLYSDGVGKFQATVWTNHTHSGDQWTVVIDVQDFRGLTLFSTPEWKSFDHMNDDGTHYPIGPVFFNYDASKFDAIQQALSHNWC